MTLEELLGMANDPKPMPGTMAELKLVARLFLPECLYNRIDWLEEDFESFDPTNSATTGTHRITINVNGGELMVTFHYYSVFGWVLSPRPFAVLRPEDDALLYKYSELPQAIAAAVAEGYKLSH